MRSDGIDAAMRTFDYHRYLASREWAVRKRQVRDRARGECKRHVVAGSFGRRMVAVHHLTYEHVGLVRVNCHEQALMLPKASRSLSSDGSRRSI